MAVNRVSAFEATGLRSFEASMLLNQSYKAFHALLATCLGHHGLTVPQWSVMGQLSSCKTMRPVDIAAALGVKPPFVTTALAELEELGLVERLADPDDGRSALAGLTVAGKTRITEVEPQLTVCLNEQFAELPAPALKSYFDASSYIATQVHHK